MVDYGGLWITYATTPDNDIERWIWQSSKVKRRTFCWYVHSNYRVRSNIISVLQVSRQKQAYKYTRRPTPTVCISSTYHIMLYCLSQLRVLVAPLVSCTTISLHVPPLFSASCCWSCSSMITCNLDLVQMRISQLSASSAPAPAPPLLFTARTIKIKEISGEGRRTRPATEDRGQVSPLFLSKQ